MKKSIIFSIVCAAIVFIVAFAMLCPNIGIIKTTASGDPEDIALPSSGTAVTRGEISPDGKISLVEGNAAVIQFPIDAQKDIKCFEINYKEPVKAKLDFYVELTIDGTFTDVPAVLVSVSKGVDTCCFEVNPAKYAATRIWFWQDSVLQDVSFYADAPLRQAVPMQIGIKRYLAVAAITLITLIFAFLIDKKLHICEKIIHYIKKRYLKIMFFICGSGSAIILGVITEIVFRIIKGADSIGNNFNVASCACFCVFYVLVFFFFAERKNISQKPEKLLLAIVLSVGTLIIAAQPMGHNCWDLDTHYTVALENSFVKNAYYTDADNAIKFNKIISTSSPTLEASEAAKQELNEVHNAAVTQSEVRRKITHIPSGVFMAVARLLGADFYTVYISGQFANLLVYALVSYFAIKKLKTGKMIAAAIVLFPTNLLIATNYSYDHWVTAFMLLGTCYFVSECEQPDKPISVWETVVMCGAFAIGSLPKQIYILLMALPLFMRKNWKDKKAKRNYYLILMACFATVFAMLLIRTFGAVSPSSAGDIRGGEVNPYEQLLYIISKPLDYAKILINHLLSYLSIGGMQGYITSFAYMGSGKTHMVFQLVLLFAMLTGKNGEAQKIHWWIRILAVLLYLGMAALMSTALYIDFTPLKSDVILGCQPRYIVPLLAPVGLTLFGRGIKICKNKAIYNYAILGVLCVAVLFDVITRVAVPMF